MKVTGSEHTSNEEIWPAAAQWLARGNTDVKIWGTYLAPHIETLTREAGYSLTRQFEAQMLLYSIILPHFGPAPSPGQRPKWISMMSDNATPIEVSLTS